MIEREAQVRGIVGTPAHLLALRKRKSAKIILRLRDWRDDTTPLFEPKSPMGAALRYMKNQWERLTVFLADASVPIHNNASEAALRIIAVDVSLCALSSSARNDERAIITRIATRATCAFATAA